MPVAAMILTSALWAVTFVAPLLLPALNSATIAGLRYGVFGAIAVVLWVRTRDALSREHWGRATLHALTGNIGHYVLAVLAVRVAGAPVTVSIIALVPIAYGLLGARHEARERTTDPGTVWRTLAPPLALTALGIVAVDAATLRDAAAPSPAALLLGIVLAAASGASWLWYGLDTARHLRVTGISAGRWTNAVGVATAPLALPLLVGGFATTDDLGSVPVLPTVAVALLLGAGSSWLATAGFNYASARLPRHLLAPLMALEPAWTLVFAHVIDGRVPGLLQLTGETLLVAGAAVALRSLRSRSAATERGAARGPGRTEVGDRPTARARAGPDPARTAA